MWHDFVGPAVVVAVLCGAMTLFLLVEACAIAVGPDRIGDRRLRFALVMITMITWALFAVALGALANVMGSS